jgi:uncharacterized RDD family membrane protein YckC
VEGSLAADPLLLTPPARSTARVEPLRDIPALRKRERSWRDEVRERVRSRRQKRAEAGLPLFDAPEPSSPEAGLAEPPAAPAPAPEEAPRSSPAPPVEAPLRETAREPDLVSTRLSEAELADLPLQAPAGPAAELETLDREAVTERRRRPAPSLDGDLLGGAAGEGEVVLTPPVVEPPPVERPARPAERARAGVVDALLFAGIAALVVYFTGRAARVGIPALAPSWPGLACYLGLLALFYAGYFTGTTGQTPGKLLTGLRVVGATGRPPSYPRAIGRALVGLAGTALAGLGLLPMIFDPASRALHDRLFRTRVVRG